MLPHVKHDIRSRLVRTNLKYKITFTMKKQFKPEIMPLPAMMSLLVLCLFSYIGKTIGILLVNKVTSGFMSNTLNIFIDLFMVYLAYRFNKFIAYLQIANN